MVEFPLMTGEPETARFNSRDFTEIHRSHRGQSTISTENMLKLQKQKLCRIFLLRRLAEILCERETGRMVLVGLGEKIYFYAFELQTTCSSIGF